MHEKEVLHILSEILLCETTALSSLPAVSTIPHKKLIQLQSNSKVSPEKWKAKIKKRKQQENVNEYR